MTLRISHGLWHFPDGSGLCPGGLIIDPREVTVEFASPRPNYLGADSIRFEWLLHVRNRYWVIVCGVLDRATYLESISNEFFHPNRPFGTAEKVGESEASAWRRFHGADKPSYKEELNQLLDDEFEILEQNQIPNADDEQGMTFEVVVRTSKGYLIRGIRRLPPGYLNDPNWPRRTIRPTQLIAPPNPQENAGQTLVVEAPQRPLQFCGEGQPVRYQDRELPGLVGVSYHAVKALCDAAPQWLTKKEVTAALKESGVTGDAGAALNTLIRDQKAWAEVIERREGRGRGHPTCYRIPQ